MKKVGVTGVAGFVGANLADRLLADGYEVIGVDDLSTGSLDNLDLALPHPSFRFIQMDCSDADALMTAFDGVDGIIHLAAKKDDSILQQTAIDVVDTLFAARRFDHIGNLRHRRPPVSPGPYGMHRPADDRVLS